MTQAISPVCKVAKVDCTERQRVAILAFDHQDLVRVFLVLSCASLLFPCWCLSWFFPSDALDLVDCDCNQFCETKCSCIVKVRTGSTRLVDDAFVHLLVAHP